TSNVHLVIDELGHGMASQRLHDFGERRADRVRFVAHHRHAEHGKLAMVLGLYLRYRDVIAVPQPLLDASYYLALVLQAARLADQQTNPKRPYNHHTLVPGLRLGTGCARGSASRLCTKRHWHVRQSLR